VNKSFQDAKDYNDKSSAFGQDIHKIAEIIFSMDLNDSDSVMTEISKRKSEFKTDITGIIENEHIRTEAVDYLLRLKRNIETTHGSGCKFLTESAYGVENLNTEGSYAAIKSKELKGIIDLIVVDKNGEIHLYDFKTSAKRYGN
jgi:ATP-dependent exoDNAse (exonuclease V) beta subunit